MIKNKLKEMLCTHEFKEVRKRVPFYARNGDVIGVSSGKCGFHTLRAFSLLIPMV